MSLKGKTVCVTGTLKACTRAQAFKIIENAGGTVNKTMASHVDIAVVGDDAGAAKLSKIQSLVII